MVKCADLTVYGLNGKLDVPRPCKRFAKDGSKYCRHHAHLRARKKYIEIVVRDGGYCSYCAEPARSYVYNGVAISLCKRCGNSLMRAIRDGR